MRTIWEYQELAVPIDTRAQTIVQQGQAGWELVALIPVTVNPQTPVMKGGQLMVMQEAPKPGFLCIFKRPKQPVIAEK